MSWSVEPVVVQWSYTNAWLVGTIGLGTHASDGPPPNAAPDASLPEMNAFWCPATAIE